MKIANLSEQERFILRTCVNAARTRDPLDPRTPLDELSAYEAVSSLRSAINAHGRGHSHDSLVRMIVLIERENDDDEDYYNESLTQAEAAFWDCFARRYPEISTGDLDPSNNEALLDACAEATSAWLQANRREAPIALDADACAWKAGPAKDMGAFLDRVNGRPGLEHWVATWEFPGYVSWSYTGGVPGFEHLTVHATPDWGSDGTISIDVMIDATCDKRWKGEIKDVPWPFAGRSAESYVAAMRPILEHFTPTRMVTTTVTFAGSTSVRGE